MRDSQPGEHYYTNFVCGAFLIAVAVLFEALIVPATVRHGLVALLLAIGAWLSGRAGWLGLERLKDLEAKVERLEEENQALRHHLANPPSRN